MSAASNPKPRRHSSEKSTREPVKLRVVIHPAEGGRFWAEVPGFPGCVSEGDTLEEVRSNIRDAFGGVLWVMQADAELHPEDATSGDRDEAIDLIRS
jgi:predicted RNase H-like HicB family nuclease